MKSKIGIFGSAADESETVVEKARELGDMLGSMDLILLSGATTGLPAIVSIAAKKQNKAELWGFSAAYDEKEHLSLTPNDDLEMYRKLLFIPESFPFSDIQARRKYRNVLATATCDAGIILSGRWGTLNEFTNLFDMGKVIGVLTGTGGIADELEELSKKISKKSSAVLLFDDSPKRLIKKLLSTLDSRAKE